jgi:regulator of RNase E activity RraA
MISRDVLDKLAAFDTPTICNVIELFEIRPQTDGYMDARIKATFTDLSPMVGFAATATFRCGAPPARGDSYSSMEAQVERFSELSGAAIVVFQDLDDPAVGATFGEMMCATYKAFGAVGLITSGAGRDIEQVRTMNFPIFTNGTICSHGYNHIPQIHVPVRVGGLTIYPNDLLHGDLNGVTNIPVDIAAEVADACPELAAAEAIVLDVLHSGSPTLTQLREARAAYQERKIRLQARVSRANLH